MPTARINIGSGVFQNEVIHAAEYAPGPSPVNTGMEMNGPITNSRHSKKPARQAPSGPVPMAQCRVAVMMAASALAAQ
jgi:hypothetical protein